MIGSRGLEDGLVTLIEVLTPGASEMLLSELEDAHASPGVSIIGGLARLGDNRIFRELDTAFSDIYESGSANYFIDQIVDGVIVLAAVVLAVVAWRS